MMTVADIKRGQVVLNELRRQLAALTAERDAARETNTKLNRRCQQAETALAEAQTIIEKKWEWRGGSFGRALLAHHASKLTEQLAAERKARVKVEARLVELVTAANSVVSFLESGEAVSPCSILHYALRDAVKSVPSRAPTTERSLT